MPLSASRRDDRGHAGSKPGTAELLFELRMQSAERLLSEMGVRLSMMEGIVFSLKRELARLEPTATEATGRVEANAPPHGTRTAPLAPGAPYRSALQPLAHRIM